MMKRLPLLTLVFSLVSVVFFLLLIFFRSPFTPYPLMSNQDFLDHLTPLVLIPLYWLLFKAGSRAESTLKEEIIFMVLAAAWVLGQGMHLAANSINNLSEFLAKSQVIDITSTSIYTLIYFFDEYLSHYLWHIALLGFVVLLLWREWRNPAEIATVWWMAIVAGILYGFTNFCIFDEGNTVAVGLPFSIILTLVIFIRGRKNLNQRPIRAFFAVSYLVSSIFLIGWWIYFGGFPPLLSSGLL